MKTFVKALGLALSVSAAWVIAPSITGPIAGVTLGTEAKAQAVPQTLDELLDAVRQGRVVENADNKAREAKFRRERNNQANLLAQAERDVKREEAISERLELESAENKVEIATLDQELRVALGEFNELIGVVKQVAGEAKAELQNSIISAEYPDRDKPVAALAAKKEIPTMAEFEALWLAMQSEITYQGKVSRFTAEVTDLTGQKSEVEVVRAGPFNAMIEGKYLKYLSADQNFAELDRQPPARFTGPINGFMRATDGFVEIGIDPARGGILGLAVLTPTLRDRIDQGALVGRIIIILAVVTILFSLLRIFALMGTRSSVRSQVRKKNASKGNPLGRVLLAYEANANADVETLELKLDEAIMKEVPKLERGLNTIKVVAAVAPMLGLLGTVTGMILTFQSIQLYGAGDPKMMAGGISQALITTVLGLVTAIPVLLLHSFASGMSSSVVHILEEQAAGIVARQAEGR